ncbi:MAG: NADH-quinone oxidoreductase subunit L [Acidimicrobiales bacterium]
MLENAFLIPLIPAISFLITLFFGKKYIGKDRVHWVGIGAVGLVWAMSLVAGYQWMDRTNHPTADAIAHVDVSHGDDTHDEDPGEGSHDEAPGEDTHSDEPAEQDEHSAPALGSGSSGDGSGLLAAAAAEGEEGDHSAVLIKPVINTFSKWWSNAGVDFAVGTHVDGLAVILLVIVSTISLLVHVYSTEYVKDDRRYVHYFAFLSLFTAAMLFFVLSQNILQMIVGWELVGVCSFALIGHWWEDRPNTDAALKAFLTNRVGDIGLLVGMIILYGTFKTFSIDEINATIAANPGMNHFALLVAGLCLMGAVMSKSGQFPLHTWLPDAMAGPTPVSALIHAATMVVAGVYMIARLYPVFYEGMSIGTSSINVMAFIGGFTALMGAGLAFVQWDIKKVLAYSTVSQLGYMVMALGVGAWTAAIFHLFTHAMFKACLFLGAGSVSHAAHHTFDMRKMGGLRKDMPVTYGTFIVASLALAGIFPFAGFWSKDEILLGALNGQQSRYPLMLIFGCAVALMTAAYMTRVIWYTFHGEFRGHGHPHESPKAMTIPLVILGFMAIVAGFFNVPSGVAEAVGLGGLAHQVQNYVEPSVYLSGIGIIHPEPSLAMAMVGLALALAGIGLAYLYFWKGKGPQNLTERNKVAKAGKTFLENKYYLDHLYTNIIVGSIKKPIAFAANWVNQNVIDRTVNVVGETARDSGKWVYKWIDQGAIDGSVNAVAHGADQSGEGLRAIQSGKVQHYGSLLFGAAAVLAIVFIIVI